MESLESPQGCVSSLAASRAYGCKIDYDDEESMESLESPQGCVSSLAASRAYGCKTDYDDGESMESLKNPQGLGPQGRVSSSSSADESLKNPQGLGPQGRVSSLSLADESLNLDDSESEMDSDADASVDAAEQSQEWINGDDEQDLPQVDESFYADDFIVIPPPPKDVLRMSHHVVPPVLLDDVVTPCVTPLFTVLLEGGLIRPMTSQFQSEVKLHPDDKRTAKRNKKRGKLERRLTSRRAVVYSVCDEMNGIKRTGSTKGAVAWEEFSKLKGTLQSGDRMLEIFNLDLIAKGADRWAQEAYYYMMKCLVAHEACPRPCVMF
jgi:hypothetical protein